MSKQPPKGWKEKDKNKFVIRPHNPNTGNFDEQALKRVRRMHEWFAKLKKETDR